MSTGRELHILNLGAGVQSTALYLMFHLAMVLRGEIQCSDWAFKAILSLSESHKQWLIDTFPKLDAAIFADTQDEPEEVYRHLNWLQSLEGPTILVRTKGRLSDDLISGQNSTGQRFASIPAFTTANGGKKVGKTRRQCSKEYKIDVIEQTIRHELVGCARGRSVPKGTIIHQYIGISLDETGRAVRVMRAKVPKSRAHEAKRWNYAALQSFFKVRQWRLHFLLIEASQTRADCLSFLGPLVPHKTPRSACVHCPFHTDLEWNRVRQVPADWRLAVAVDHGLRTTGAVANRQMDQQMFLHRSCQPLELVQLDLTPKPREEQLSMSFTAECLGVCGV